MSMYKTIQTWLFPLLALAALSTTAWAQQADPLRALGCLDVTQPPYNADPTARTDSTKALQEAINDARDAALACFFPEGTYLISDTLSGEQEVAKLDRPRATDGKTQHYWDKPHRIVMIGSTKGNRPVLKLATNAPAFDDPDNPKLAVWIWAQTRDDARGKQEPAWGVEQPNISFSHIFKGIDIDLNGHPGAIGIRHSGSQGSTLQDCTILAQGAYAGLSNCCGQGGGTHNISVKGGRYGILIDPTSRFPLLNACDFQGQTEAAIQFVRPNQVPTLLVGCRIEPRGTAAISFRGSSAGAGISLADCLVSLPPGGIVCQSNQNENVFMENTHIQGAKSITRDGPLLDSPTNWTRVDLYSTGTPKALNLINGQPGQDLVKRWQTTPDAPSFESIHERHYRPSPSFEDPSAVAVASFGAKGDGTTDDTPAFQQAISASDTVFVPKGTYRLEGSLALRPSTQLFGLSASNTSIGGTTPGGSRNSPAPPGALNRFTLTTPNDPAAHPTLAFLSIRGQVDWRSGQGTCMLAPSALSITGAGGGRFYGVTGMGRPFVLRGIRQPTAFYALNVERVTSNPQSLIDDCSHLRLYFFKVEAGTLNRDNAPDGNTPCRIANSEDVRIYCMYGVVRKLGDRPMLDIADSKNIQVSQLATLQRGSSPHLIETIGARRSEIPGTHTGALMLRDAETAP